VLLLRHSYTRWQRKWLFLELRILGRVNEYLYRGAQPKEEGIEELKKLGIDTIVDLRGERHGLMEKERAHAELLGMRLVSIPGTGWTAPRDEQVAQFFAPVSETPRGKSFHTLLVWRRSRCDVRGGVPDCV
jgi:hypothetical protein